MFSKIAFRVLLPIAGMAVVLAIITPSNAIAAPTNDEVRHFLETEIAACQVKLDSATTSAQRQRAQTCIDDATRALNSLNTTPSPTPSTPTSTTSVPVPTTTSVSTTSTTQPPTTTTPPTGEVWPTPANSGVPAFWTPRSTVSNNMTVGSGATVEDVLFTNGADLIVNCTLSPRTLCQPATIRRVMFQGGVIGNRTGTPCSPMNISQSTLRRASGTVTDSDQEGAVRVGGYTADRLFLDSVPEGFRIGGTPACGPVAVSNTFVRIRAPDTCNDWHGDGFQGYGGNALTIRNVTIDFDGNSQCGGGTSSFFYPRNQGNTSADIDRLLINNGGEGFAFRLGMPGRVTNLKIVNNSWYYGPISVRCSVLTTWEAKIVTVDASWNPTTVRNQPCNTEDGI